MPPNCRQRGVMLVGIPTSKACDTAEEGDSSANSTSLTTGAETSGTVSSGSWGGGLEMVADGVWQHFLGWVGWRTQGNEIWLPPGAHINPMPLILPLLIQSYVTLPFPVAGPPPSMHLLFLANPDPEKKEWGLSQRSNLSTELWRNG